MVDSVVEAGLVVIGLARDCADTLPGVFSYCERLGDLFSSVEYVFIENSSVDATRAILESWSSTQNHVTVLTPFVECDAQRTVRIASCRNTGMDYIRSNCKNFDLIMVVDLDLELEACDANAIPDVAKYLMSSEGIGAVFPNAIPLYYDVYALRHQFWCPNDVWHEVAELHKKWRDEINLKTAPEDQFVHSRQIPIAASVPPIKVDSAFGGIGLYKKDQALGSRYCGVDEDSRNVCEHVSFNTNISSEKYILPFWNIRAPMQHLSSAFRTERPIERNLRLLRSRIQLRENLLRLAPFLTPLIKRCISDHI